VIVVEAATAEAVVALAALHEASFDDPWSAAEIESLLRSPGVFALTGAPAGEGAGGFILFRVAADEAEVLTLAVTPAMRRRGLASALLDRATVIALAAGAGAMFLEVAIDNVGAQALYRGRGFEHVGWRPAYFSRPGGAVAAHIMRCDLNR
jgi:[ribosomal protein S18]-alanine N-acetyltransferase